MKTKLFISVLALTSIAFTTINTISGSDSRKNKIKTLITDKDRSFAPEPKLTQKELSFLLKMKEEEKLAHDLYTVLLQKWGHIMYSHISSAETIHMKAINNLLKFYGSPDTVFGEQGVFTDKEVQDLYNKLVSKGSESAVEGFKTGELIEEMDIKDLDEAIAGTEKENIRIVYGNLKRASGNHLRAFYRQLKFKDVIYTPVYISQSEYDRIISAVK